MPVDVQESSASDPASLEKSWRYGEARVAAPDDGAFPGAGIYEDERHLAESSSHLSEIAMDSGAAEFATVQFSGVIVSDDTNIMGAQPPSLAGDEGSGDLTAEQDLGAEHFHLGT